MTDITPRAEEGAKRITLAQVACEAWRFEKPRHFLNGQARAKWTRIVAAVISANARQPSDEEPLHIRIYHEDFGPVLWWTRPVSEPPYVGHPLCDDWPGYHQWWTPLPPIPRKLCRKDR